MKNSDGSKSYDEDLSPSPCSQGSNKIGIPSSVSSISAASSHRLVLTKANVEALVQVFITKVDPFIRIIHKPSFLCDLKYYLKEKSGDLRFLKVPGSSRVRSVVAGSIQSDRQFEPLLLAVLYSAIVSQSEAEFSSHFPNTFVEKVTLSKLHHDAFHASLANTNYLDRDDLNTLQALALYLVGLP